MSKYKPKLVCFSCKFSWGYLANEEALSREIENWVPVICTGKIDATHMLEAFKAGADGILILGCAEGSCHYQDGNYEAKKRVYLLRSLLESFGIEKERIRMKLSTDPEGKGIRELVENMKTDLARLGPAKKGSERPIKARGGKQYG